MIRMELLHHAKEWMKENCKGEQPSNLSKDRLVGLKRLRERKKNGELVILPTDKSGRFAVMSMDTYIKAGEVHTKKDEEIGLKELKANQKQVNGSVSKHVVEDSECGGKVTAG